MQIGPWTIARTKGIQLAPLSGRGGWWPITIREPYTGAWQRNAAEVSMDTALSFSAVFACTTLIMGDTGKVCLRLVEQDSNGIWSEVENPAYSPVLRRPNRYQNMTQFKETWTASKLNSGNVYVLMVRDRRTVVTSMFVLDPSRVTPLIAPDGSIYYELRRDDISGLPQETVTVPASEIIHDRMNCLFHPLIGLSPLFACALTAGRGLAIQNNFSKLVSNGAIPGGVLTAPGAISNDTALRLKAYWETEFTGDNVGKVAVLGDGLKYEGMAWNAVDLQLVEHLKLTGEIVCTAYRVPPCIVDVGPPPPYANVEPVILKYWSQCLHSHFNQIELCLDDGLGLGKRFSNNYGTEFDVDDLIWMDTAARGKAASDSAGTLSPNEARYRFYNAKPVKGGETPYLQEQNWPLALLAARELPTRAPTAPAPIAEPATDEEDDDEEAMAASFGALLHQKALEAELIHA